MLSPSTLHDLASGKRRGLFGSLFRAATSIAEIPVAWYVRRRNQAYDEGRAKIHRVDAPVISVGNLTAGGTGKTPMVEWIARWLQEQGRAAIVISRGYGSAPGQKNDEARELAAKLPGVPHLQQADRVSAARAALATHPGSVLLLDDAFQHRRVHRDLDIVLLDGLAPFGFDHLIPRGLLREPVQELKRAQVVVLSRSNLVDQSARAAIRARVRQVAPQAVWCEAMHAPRGLVSSSGQRQPIDWLQGKRIAAFCGIGNPAGFRRTLDTLGAEIVAWREFPDHCAYNERQLSSLDRWALEANVDAVVCTHKDLVKITLEKLAGRPLLALVVGMQFLCGEQEFTAALERAIAIPPPASSSPGRA